MFKQKPRYTSKEAKMALKVSDCQLKHLRDEGKLEATKNGNAFMYDSVKVDELAETMKKQKKVAKYSRHAICANRNCSTVRSTILTKAAKN